MAKNIYDVVSAYSYTPVKVTLFEDLDIKPGDIIKVDNKDALVMSKVMSSTGVVFESFGAATRNNVISESEKYEATNYKYNVLKRDLDGTVSIVSSNTSRLDGDGNNSIEQMRSTISQTASSISLVVDTTKEEIKAAEIMAAINDDTSEVKISANKVNIEGDIVTFADLAGEGTTVINGSNISTGSISADRIAGGTLSGSDININNNFTVDSNGNLQASSGIFTGDYVEGQSIKANFTEITGDLTVGNDISTDKIFIGNKVIGKIGGSEEIPITVNYTAEIRPPALDSEPVIILTSDKPQPENASFVLHVGLRYFDTSSMKQVTVTAIGFIDLTQGTSVSSKTWSRFTPMI